MVVALVQGVLLVVAAEDFLSAVEDLDQVWVFAVWVVQQQVVLLDIHLDWTNSGGYREKNNVIDDLNHLSGLISQFERAPLIPIIPLCSALLCA